MMRCGGLHAQGAAGCLPSHTGVGQARGRWHVEDRSWRAGAEASMQAGSPAGMDVRGHAGSPAGMDVR
eukprot:115241-Chlamydomonas_euryale.AAC.1